MHMLFNICSSLLVISLLIIYINANTTFETNVEVPLETRRCEPYSSFSIVTSFDVNNCFLKSIEERHLGRHPDLGKSVEELLDSYSFQHKNYTVTSADGYTSSIYRILGGPRSPPRHGKPSVLLVHGGGANCKSWMIQHGDTNLAFKLANAGYDVWLLNARGSSLSRGHLRLDATKDLAYWNFTMDDMAIHDIPIVIELLLQETGNSQTYYVCHSMGCHLYYMSLIHKPELNVKIKAGLLTSPGGAHSHSYGWIRQMSNIVLQTDEDKLFWLLGGKIEQNAAEFWKWIGLTSGNICSIPLLKCLICSNIFWLFDGFDAPQLNYTNLPNVIDKLGDTLPIKAVFQPLQNIRACKYQMYDFGPEGNQIKYGQPEPPAYNMSLVQAPTYLFFSERDPNVTPWDAEELRISLPVATLRGFYKVDWPLFNHIDFLMAKNADDLLYNKILAIMDKHEKDENVL